MISGVMVRATRAARAWAVVCALASVQASCVPMRRVEKTPEPLIAAARARYPRGLIDARWRARQGRGMFIGRQQIETRHPVQITDLLPRTLFYVGPDGGGLYNLRGECMPAVFLDGVPVTDMVFDERMSSGQHPVGPIDMIPPSDVDLIEIYTGLGDTPAELARFPVVCGAIAIWTRRDLPDEPSVSGGGR
ncbi:MAG: hypothetical protein P8099_01855 [Gemmatimonadota bacterium]|jgi:hypothetical protein